MRRAANPLPSGRPVKKRAVDHEEFTWIVPGPDRPSHRVLERSPRLEQWPEHVLGGTFQEYKSMSPYHIWCNQDAFVRYILGTPQIGRRFTAIIEAKRPVRLLLDVDLSQADLLPGKQMPPPTRVWDSVTTLLQRYLDITTVKNIDVRQECWTFSSHRADKISFHLYFPDLVFQDVEQLKLLITQGFHRFLLEHIRAGDPVALPLARNPTKDGHPKTAVDHLIYHKKRHMRVALCHKPGKPNLKYDRTLHPAGRPLPSPAEQLKACLPHPVGASYQMQPPVDPQLVVAPQAFLWAGRAQPNGSPGAQQSFDAYMAPLRVLNPITRTYTAQRHKSLAEAKAANPGCVRYHGVLDLDVPFDARHRRDEYLSCLRKARRPFKAADVPFPEFQRLLAAVQKIPRDSGWCYFSGSGFRVLLRPEESLWTSGRFCNASDGHRRIITFLTDQPWGPAVKPYVDRAPYQPNCGTKADLRASTKTGLWPQLVKPGMLLQQDEDAETSRTIRRYWANVGLQAGDRLAQAPRPAAMSPGGPLGRARARPGAPPGVTKGNRSMSTVVEEALRAAGDLHSKVTKEKSACKWYCQTPRHHRPRRCLAGTRREHQSNNFEVEQDGAHLWYFCHSKHCPGRVKLAFVRDWRPPVNDWRVPYQTGFDSREVHRMVQRLGGGIEAVRKPVMAYFHRYFARVGVDSGQVYVQRLARRGFRILSRLNLLNVLEACQVTLMGTDAKPKRVHLGHWWLQDASAPTFDRMVFNPRAYGSPGAANTREFNTYTGPGVSRQDASQADPRDAQPLLDHIRTIWCRGDEELYTYVLNWLASVVQRPWHKLGVALLLQGEQGSGKGCVVEFIKPIVGDSFKAVHRADPVLGTFNTALLGSSLLFLDEMFWGGDKKLAGAWKALITEPVHQINQKYLPIISQKSCHNVIVASNNAHLAPVELKDRRSLVLSIDNKHAGSQDATSSAYFQRLRQVPVKAFARVLYTRDLRGWNSRRFPHTDAIQAQQEQSLGPVHRWWIKVITDGFIEGAGAYGARAQLSLDQTTECDKASVYTSFTASPMVQAKFTNDAHFWRTMKVLVPDLSYRRVRVGEARNRTVVFPPLPQLKAQWTARAGGRWRFSDD